jgi:hypothetical protein
LGRKKYADAEPLLMAGYAGMMQREAKMPPQDKFRLTEALERRVRLDEERGHKDMADELRKKREKGKAPKTDGQAVTSRRVSRSISAPA